MTDIEQARMTLTKWGDGVTPGPWGVSKDVFPDVMGAPGGRGRKIVAESLRSADATLIVAMTDPALREALDGMLAHVINYPGWTSGHMRAYVDRIAAVIIAIDQRMNA